VLQVQQRNIHSYFSGALIHLACGTTPNAFGLDRRGKSCWNLSVGSASHSSALHQSSSCSCSCSRSRSYK